MTPLRTRVPWCRVRRASWFFILLASVTGCTGSSFSGAAGGASAGAAGSSGGGNGGTGGSGASSSGSAGRAAGGGSSGKSGRGGSGSSGTSNAGESGAAGEAGEGGEGPSEPSCTGGARCPDGRYCAAEGRCVPCDDLTSLDDPAAARFAEPEPLAVLNDATALHYLRYPRAFGNGTALIYEREFFGRELWLTGNPETEVGAPLASPVGQPDFHEGAGLWLGSPGSGALMSNNFVFNRAPVAGGPAELHAALVEPNGAATASVRLPAPFNANAPTVESSFSMAVSAKRAWWMVNRDSMLDVRFYTAPLDGSAPPSVVTLKDQHDCVLGELDLGAWVTPDGKLLFVNAAERDATCQLLPDDPRDILVFKLDATGQAIGKGTVLPDLHTAGSTEADASLSADTCWLFFTKMQDTGRLGLMRARRDG